MIHSQFRNIGYPYLTQTCEKNVSINFNSYHLSNEINYYVQSKRIYFDSEIDEKPCYIRVTSSEDENTVVISPKLFGMNPSITLSRCFDFPADKKVVGNVMIPLVYKNYKLKCQKEWGNDSNKYRLSISMKQPELLLKERLRFKNENVSLMASYSDLLSAKIQLGETVKFQGEITFNEFCGIFYDFKKQNEIQRNKLGFLGTFNNNLIGIAINFNKYLKIKTKNEIFNNKFYSALKIDKDHNVYSSIAAKMNVFNSKMFGKIDTDGIICTGIKRNVGKKGQITFMNEIDLKEKKYLGYEISLSFNH